MRTPAMLRGIAALVLLWARGKAANLVHARAAVAEPWSAAK